MIDLAQILAPISGELPAGRNLRLVPGDTTIATLDEMRREADPELDFGGKGKAADWKGAAALSSAALAEKSKDLQISAYLAEALARTQGYPGLLEGLRIVRGLLEKFWDGMHPGAEDGEIILAVRAKWLSWIGSSNDFRRTVKRIPITAAVGGVARSWLDQEEARRLDEAAMMSDKTTFNELQQSGRISSEEWRNALAATQPAHLEGILSSVRACDEELNALTVFCDEKFGGDAPSLLSLSDLLQECRGQLERFLAGIAPPPEEAESTSSSVAGTPGGSRGGASGPIGTRDDAYRRLREVAEYLRRAEPHSPVSYLIDRAVRWGQMPFQDLLRDVLKHNEDARTTVLETLGLAEPEE